MGENPSAVFGGNIESWDLNKVRLIGWCRFYDSIKSAFGVPPPDDIYDNDYKLDRWVKMKRNEREEKLKGNSSKNTGPRDGPRNRRGMNDVYDSSVIKQ